MRRKTIERRRTRPAKIKRGHDDSAMLREESLSSLSPFRSSVLFFFRENNCMHLVRLRVNECRQHTFSNFLISSMCVRIHSVHRHHTRQVSWLSVFFSSLLQRKELVSCIRVCRAWCSSSLSRSLDVCAFLLSLLRTTLTAWTQKGLTTAAASLPTRAMVLPTGAYIRPSNVSPRSLLLGQQRFDSQPLFSFQTPKKLNKQTKNNSTKVVMLVTVAHLSYSFLFVCKARSPSPPPPLPLFLSISLSPCSFSSAMDSLEDTNQENLLQTPSLLMLSSTHSASSPCPSSPPFSVSIKHPQQKQQQQPQVDDEEHLLDGGDLLFPERGGHAMMTTTASSSLSCMSPGIGNTTSSSSSFQLSPFLLRSREYARQKAARQQQQQQAMQQQQHVVAYSCIDAGLFLHSGKQQQQQQNQLHSRDASLILLQDGSKQQTQR